MKSLRLRSITLFLLAILACSLVQQLIAAEVYEQLPAVVPSTGVNAKPVEAAVPKDRFEKGPRPSWIWGDSPANQYLLSKEIPSGAKSAHLIATCDNGMKISINGKHAFSSSQWESPKQKDVTSMLQSEGNVITASVDNEGSVSGFVCKLVLTMPDGKLKYVVSDTSWKAQLLKDGKPTTDSKIVVTGKLGDSPWGNVFSREKATQANEEFITLPGFQVELLYNVDKNVQGSWVSITTDPKGRIIASDQGGKGLWRITPANGKQPTRVEKLNLAISSAQGLLCAFDSLYISVNGGPGSGLYRAQDMNGDDQYDKLEKLKSLQGGGEHGPHGLRLSPDGKSIYLIAGNHTNPPENFDTSRPPKNWNEDLLLPRQWDARGHARGKLAPGGWIAKTDPEGKTWEMFSIGYRNPYDMDFNADGELFAYDADMEWDMGSPWYRPTRVVHATSGSEFGWRSGTGKWPTYYVDSLPPMVNIGPGSPVGAQFGYGAKFPAKYQKALYICDWTFGTMYAIHLTPEGSSYKATKEEFVARTPLPLTDVTIGTDGAMYFTIGGRGAQSALYRVTYVGDADTKPAELTNTKGADLRLIRKDLELQHEKKNVHADQLGVIGVHLDEDDRFIRYAARVALEHLPVDIWRAKVSGEDRPLAMIQLAVALSRQGEPSDQAAVFDLLGKINFAKLNEESQLDLIRAYALAIVRLGQPSDEIAEQLATKFDAFYPAASDSLNRELVQLLVALKSPTVITKTLKLIAQPSPDKPNEMVDLLSRNGRYGGSISAMYKNMPETQKVHYALALRNMKYGWTIEQRKEYLAWLDEAGKRSGGASYQGFIANIRKESLENASPAEIKQLGDDAAPPVIVETDLPQPIGPGRTWTVADLVAKAESGLTRRNFENGKRSYAAARCLQCHRFGGEGGATGPDLTNVAGRFSVKDLAEAMIEPSKVISDQYRTHNVETAKGQILVGRLIENKDSVTVLTDAIDPNKSVEIARDDIVEIAPSKVSFMPNNLLNTLSEEEALDLIAYLLSRGNPKHRMFAR